MIGQTGTARFYLMGLDGPIMMSALDMLDFPMCVQVFQRQRESDGIHGIYHLHVYFLMLPESYFPDDRFKINVPATVIDLRSSYPLRPAQAPVSTSHNFTSMHICVYIYIYK